MKRIKRFIPIYIIIMLLCLKVDALSGTAVINELPENTEKGQYFSLKHTIDTNASEISLEYSYDKNYIKLVGYTSADNVKCSFSENTITCNNVLAKNTFLYPVFKIINTFNENKDIAITYITTETYMAKTTINKTDKIIEVTNIELDSYEENILVDANYQIISTVLPENANNKTITYNSTNPDVATVTQNGVVTGVSEGTTTITVMSGNIKSTFTVHVKNEEIPLEKITLQENIELKEGESEMLNITYTPEDTTTDLSNIVYSSSDEKVAIIDSTGKVIALKEGTATITVSVGEQTASTSITITKDKVDEQKEEKSNFMPCLITGIITFILTSLLFFIKSLINRKKELDGGNDSDNDDNFKLNSYI